jgi:ATP-binding cassette subfamily B protein
MLVGRLQRAAHMVHWAITGFGRIARTTESFLWLREYERRMRQEQRGTAEPPTRLRDGIRLEQVSFTYPGTDTPALRDATLHLPAGSVIAIVGENGAGKSTLVALITGMYAPTTDASCSTVSTLRTSTSRAGELTSRERFRTT